MTYLKEEKKQALAQFLSLENAEDIQENYNNIFEVDGEEYEILTDDEADDRWEEELDNYLEECIFPDLPDFCRNYFDADAWKRDARFDGRGHAISRYDGNENEETINGTTFYIYRQ